MSLKQKHALITGASRGIGRGIALKLAEEGVKIGIHYYRNDSAAKDTLEQVRKRGSDGFIVQADVCRPDEITRIFSQVRTQFGKLDIFVSNARPEAAEFFQPPMDITLKQWDAASDSQGKAFLIAVREASALMPARGRIIAITYAQAGPAACCPGWGWVQRRRRSSRLSATSPWRSPSAALQSMRSVLGGRKTAC